MISNPRVKHFLLIASLLLNIFLISWAGGQWLKQRIVYTSLLNGVMHTVPVEARPLFRQNLQTDKDKLVQALAQLREGRDKVSSLLMQTELDKRALEQAMAQVQSNLNIIVTLLQSAVSTTMRDLPPDVRHEWAQQWQQGNNLLADGIERFSRELDK